MERRERDSLIARLRGLELPDAEDMFERWVDPVTIGPVREIPEGISAEHANLLTEALDEEFRRGLSDH